MGRGVTKDALANSGTDNAASSGAQSRAQGIFSTLAPELTQEATNPQGYAANDLAAMNTASQQSVGGSQAAATGQGGLLAARTRNAGGANAAIAQAARTGGQTLSTNALDVQGQNANLKQKQQQAGLAGLSGLYGSNVGQGESYAGLSNQSLNAATEADQATTGAWQNTWGMLNGTLGAGAAAKKAFGF